MKMAAAEALLETEQPAAFSVFATGALDVSPESKNRELKIPHLLSLLATAQLERRGRRASTTQRAVPSGATAPASTRRCMAVIYWSFRVMVYGVGAARGRCSRSPACWLWRKGAGAVAGASWARELGVAAAVR